MSQDSFTLNVDVARLEIIHYPAAVLRRKAEPIPQINDVVREVARRMVELMHEAEGVGLAAPQVGLSWRLFVANPTGEPDDNRVYINPRLIQPSRQMAIHEEGCLSLPQVRGEVSRPETITIQALGLDGQPVEETAGSLRGRVWQHEFDHLEGILITDKMSLIDRMANRRHLRDLEREGAR